MKFCFFTSERFFMLLFLFHFIHSISNLISVIKVSIVNQKMELQAEKLDDKVISLEEQIICVDRFGRPISRKEVMLIPSKVPLQKSELVSVDIFVTKRILLEYSMDPWHHLSLPFVYGPFKRLILSFHRITQNALILK